MTRGGMACCLTLTDVPGVSEVLDLMRLRPRTFGACSLPEERATFLPSSMGSLTEHLLYCASNKLIFPQNTSSYGDIP